MPRSVCMQCGYHGKAKNATKGSLIIEIVLWLCFLLPGLIYSLWRQSAYRKVCPKCGSEQMVPDNTPMARKMLQEING